MRIDKTKRLLIYRSDHDAVTALAHASGEDMLTVATRVFERGIDPAILEKAERAWYESGKPIKRPGRPGNKKEKA